MRKVAIIQSETRFDTYGDDHESITKIIDTWTEISDEDFNHLREASYRNNFIIIEQPTDQAAFIKDTILSYIEKEKLRKEKEEEDNAKRAAAAIKKKLQKDLKDKQSKLELFEKLKKELQQD